MVPALSMEGRGVSLRVCLSGLKMGGKGVSLKSNFVSFVSSYVSDVSPWLCRLVSGWDDTMVSSWEDRMVSSGCWVDPEGGVESSSVAMSMLFRVERIRGEGGWGAVM